MSRCNTLIHQCKLVLRECARQLFLRKVDVKRPARIYSLINDGDITAAEREIISLVLDAQLNDGGWSDVEETIWCSELLARSGPMYKVHESRAITWLRAMQHADGGWGLSDRDASRIPTTGLALTLLPGLANERAIRWLTMEWQKDLDSEVKLTYKGGFALMALARCRDPIRDEDLVDGTLAYLQAEQNDDGGFGPWRNHPIGSDPWSTGITLAGLTSWPDKVDRRVIERAVEWLCATQLDSGLWPYHFIDEGSAYAYWGLTRAVEYLEKAIG